MKKACVYKTVFLKITCLQGKWHSSSQNGGRRTEDRKYTVNITRSTMVTIIIIMKFITRVESTYCTHNDIDLDVVKWWAASIL